MKSELPKKIVKMLWDMSEVSKMQTTQNVISAAKSNEIKITHEDLQKMVYIVNSTIEQVCINSTKNFENRLSEMVHEEISSKSGKEK